MDLNDVSYLEYDDLKGNTELREMMAMTLINDKDKLKRANMKDVS